MKKRSLFAAVAMLLVSAVVLTSATYAWFAAGSKADIDQIKAKVTAGDGTLQIATITTGNDANWGISLPYTAWLNSNGTCIDGSWGANTTSTSVINGETVTTQNETVLVPISYDIASGRGTANTKKGHLTQILSSTDANWADGANNKKFNFVTGDSVTNSGTNPDYIDLKFYVRSSTPCTITIAPSWNSGADFIYGAVTAAPAYTSTTDAAAAAAAGGYNETNVLTAVHSTSSTGYIPVVNSPSGANAITKLDSQTFGYIDATEDGNTDTILKQGANATITPDNGNVTFAYTADMAAGDSGNGTAVECHMIIWAEGQDPTCTGTVSTYLANMSVTLTKV